MKKANNVVRIPTSLNCKFFRYWFEFLEPFHKLTDREIDVITSFVKHRYELSKVIKDDEILDKVTMSEDTKMKVRELFLLEVFLMVEKLLLLNMMLKKSLINILLLV